MVPRHPRHTQPRSGPRVLSWEERREAHACVSFPLPWDYLVSRMDNRADTRRYVLWYQGPGDRSSGLESGRSGEDSQNTVPIIFILDQSRGLSAVRF